MSQDDDVVNFKEAVEEDQLREERAIAVLGDVDENTCSYPMGYMERQAVFSCTSCDPLQSSPAGICYACAMQCHQDHVLIELYTKRNFRCDCGNSKFDEKCKLHEEKDELNSKNVYDQNFRGKYCTCKRPYPDPEDEIEDEMIQCVICEDWYHTRHLGCLSPAEFAEMICDQCVQKHVFLKYYKEYEVPPVVTVTKSETDQEVNVTSTDDASENQTVDNKDASETCVLEKLKKKHTDIPKDELVAMFIEDGWRGKLCQCEPCLNMYKSEGISYIVNEEDTIRCYEEKGKKNAENLWEEQVKKITSLDKVQQVELLHGYHELKSGLQEFVSGFSEGQVIRKEDVDDFFENLNKQKRRRLDGWPSSG